MGNTSEEKGSAGKPPSPASQIPLWTGYTCKRLGNCQAAIAGRPAPTGFGVHLREIGRLAGRHRWQASSHCGPGTPARDWSAVRQPSPAGQLPQGSVYTCKRLGDCQAAIAGRPAPTGFGVHLQEIGRLAGRHRWRGSSHRVRCTSARDWSAVRPPSLASQLPQGNGVHLRETGRLAGRHRWQASSHSKSRRTARSSPLNRPSVSSPAAFDLAFDLPAPSEG
jgi:hypothetical protein